MYTARHTVMYRVSIYIVPSMNTNHTERSMNPRYEYGQKCFRVLQGCWEDLEFIKICYREDYLSESALYVCDSPNPLLLPTNTPSCCVQRARMYNTDLWSKLDVCFNLLRFVSFIVCHRVVLPSFLFCFCFLLWYAKSLKSLVINPSADLTVSLTLWLSCMSMRQHHVTDMFRIHTRSWIKITENVVNSHVYAVESKIRAIQVTDNVC